MKHQRVVAAFLSSVLFGCSATELKQGAERIIVSKTGAPHGCKFVAAVVGNQGGSLTGGMTSNRTLAQGALNDIRNQALDVGANYVHLETARAGNTGDGKSYQETDVTMTGNAYRCPPQLIGLD